jgi:hypothetical protein
MRIRLISTNCRAIKAASEQEEHREHTRHTHMSLRHARIIACFARCAPLPFLVQIAAESTT